MVEYLAVKEQTVVAENPEIRGENEQMGAEKGFRQALPNSKRDSIHIAREGTYSADPVCLPSRAA